MKKQEIRYIVNLAARALTHFNAENSEQVQLLNELFSLYPLNNIKTIISRPVDLKKAPKVTSSLISVPTNTAQIYNDGVKVYGLASWIFNKSFIGSMVSINGTRHELDDAKIEFLIKKLFIKGVYVFSNEYPRTRILGLFVTLLIAHLVYDFIRNISLTEKNIFICIEKTLEYLLNDVIPYISYKNYHAYNVDIQNALNYVKYDLLKRTPDTFSDYAYLI